MSIQPLCLSLRSARARAYFIREICARVIFAVSKSKINTSGENVYEQPVSSSGTRLTFTLRSNNFLIWRGKGKFESGEWLLFVNQPALMHKVSECVYVQCVSRVFLDSRTPGQIWKKPSTRRRARITVNANLSLPHFDGFRRSRCASLK